MKRVCHVVQSYYPRDPRVRRQAEALVESGLSVDVVCLRGNDEKAREIINGVHVRRVSLSRRRGSALRYLFEYFIFLIMASVVLAMRISRYDVIHVSNLPDFLVFSALIPKVFGARVILDEHDPMPELLMSKYGMRKQNRAIKFVRWQERISLQLADHILTVNDAMKERYEKISRGKPISVVMNLPDNKLFQTPKSASSIINSNDRFILLYTGTVSDTYGLDLVVEAVANLKPHIPGLYLRIVGEGPDISRLSELAKNKGISDSVEFCGIVPFDKIPPIIAESDIGISTLKLDDLTDLCFNNKTAEYVAMGLPTVVTHTRTVAKYFPSGIVRFFEAGDIKSFEAAVLELYGNVELRREMSRSGVEFSKTSNWSIEKKKYIELVKNL